MNDHAYEMKAIYDDQPNYVLWRAREKDRQEAEKNDKSKVLDKKRHEGCEK